jgi:hypothetical protein
MKHIINYRNQAWRVTIKRKGLRYYANFPFGTDKAAALERAKAERDRFYAIVGRTSPRSNTGVAGISEYNYCRHSYSRMVFAVTYGDPRTHGLTRIPYDTFAEREPAFRRAIALRARLAGEDAAELLRQAQEVGCV